MTSFLFSGTQVARAYLSADEKTIFRQTAVIDSCCYWSSITAELTTVQFPILYNTYKKKKTQMDIYTIIIMALLITAISWYLTICITEERRLIKENNQMKQKNQERVKRLGELTKKT
jgi:p-aminobenzoyl-glutamate transporter AbgT